MLRTAWRRILRAAQNSLLLFSRSPANIEICKVAPVVAAVRRFARRGDLGLKVRS